jgi:hypothetical protein
MPARDATAQPAFCSLAESMRGRQTGEASSCAVLAGGGRPLVRVDEMNRLRDSDHIDRLEPWFALQIEFAEAVAARSGMRLDTALTFYTNLHRRFGFGRPSRDDPAPEWRAFVRALVELGAPVERVACAKAFARQHIVDWWDEANPRFGCFSFEPPVAGMVRLHFAPVDLEGGSGPLSGRKTGRRLDELAAMIEHIRSTYGDEALNVVGGSWLYNLEAYRRLFPPKYIASLRIASAPVALAGGSWWGQFLDHDGDLVVARADAFRANFAVLRSGAEWRAFPLPALAARAEVATFQQFFAGSS